MLKFKNLFSFATVPGLVAGSCEHGDEPSGFGGT
jgi:hypothetical protein